MLTDKELKLVVMELETESISPGVYRYHTKYGLSVVYYMFDIQKLENLVFEPIYLYTEDIECLDRSEDELFKIILDNTVSIMQNEIIPYSAYLKEFQKNCFDAPRLELIRRIVEAMEKVEEEKMLWCITSRIRERGASGVFCTEMLKRFCEEHHFQRLLLGVSNNDFVFLSGESGKEIIHNMQALVSQVSHVIDEEDNIIQRAILIYDYDTDTLKIWEGNWNERASSLN